MKLSVIICTHNPREDYLRRTLDALETQSLPRDQWELFLIDNASKLKLSESWDISWHPHGYHIRENELGLTAARLRGIEESNSELLIFVDDDNVLNEDYLQETLNISDAFPFVGAYNGSTMGDYDEALPSWTRRLPEWPLSLMHELATREIKEDSWACLSGVQALVSAPCGAGMVIRKKVASYYADLTKNDPIRRGLGRKGGSLASAEDSDMALCACRLGLAVGVFTRLSLKHLIPPERLEKKYLLRLTEGVAFSHTILKYIHENKIQTSILNPTKLGKAERILKWYQRLRMKTRADEISTFRDQIFAARAKGMQAAAQHLVGITGEEYDKK